MRQHPSRWDLVNPHRAWFKMLAAYWRHDHNPTWDDYFTQLTWMEYLRVYRSHRATFNYLVEREPQRAFTDTLWCLLRQPFRHRWTRWDQVLMYMPHDHGRTLLDYGCGTGEMMAWLQRRRPTWLYDGIDLESPQLSYARHRGFVAPQPTYCYDIVTCYETLEHLPNPMKAVEEMLRYLRPNGVLLWDFIDDYEGGNVATQEARREVLRMLKGTTGQREVYRA